MARGATGRPAASPACGCAAHAEPGPEDGTGRRALGVDAGAKARNRNRLRRIEGQVRGLQHMVEGDRYCADVLVQVAAVQEALRAVSRELLRNHLRHCVAQTVVKGPEGASAMYDELVGLFDKHS